MSDVEGAMSTCLIVCTLQQRHAGSRPSQLEMHAGPEHDHDYSVNSATSMSRLTENQTLDDRSKLDYERMHLKSRFGTKRFASSDKEIQFHTGYVCLRRRCAPFHRKRPLMRLLVQVFHVQAFICVLGPGGGLRGQRRVSCHHGQWNSYRGTNVTSA